MTGRTNAGQVSLDVKCAVEVKASLTSSYTYHFLKGAYDIHEPIAVAPYSGYRYFLYLLPESGTWTIERRFGTTVYATKTISLNSSDLLMNTTV